MSSVTGIIVMILIGITGNFAFLLFVWLYNKHDLKKFERELRRKDRAVRRFKFEYMLDTVHRFTKDRTPDLYRSTIRSINDVRIMTWGEATDRMLDLLYSEVAIAGHSTADWEKIEMILGQLGKRFSQSGD